MPRWDVWRLLKMKSGQTFWPMRCAVYYTYVQSYWIIRTWNNFDLDCWIYHRYEWRQCNALLQLYKCVRWSLDWYILVHWLAPGVRLGLVSLPRIPTLLATDTQALLVDQVVQNQTKQYRPSLMDTNSACDPTSWPASQLTIKDTNTAYDGHTGTTCGPKVAIESYKYPACWWTNQLTNQWTITDTNSQHCLRYLLTNQPTL